MSTDPKADNPLAPEPEAAAAPAEAEEATISEPPPPMEGLPLRGEAAPRPVIERAPRDPMAAARAALSQAADARGAELTPIPAGRRHPLQAAQEALAKAQAAREHATKGGAAGLAREADARAQLQALRTSGYTPPSPPSIDSDAHRDPPPTGAPAPKKRTL